MWRERKHEDSQGLATVLLFRVFRGIQSHRVGEVNWITAMVGRGVESSNVLNGRAEEECGGCRRGQSFDVFFFITLHLI